MRFVSFRIFVYCFCIVLGFQAFCIWLFVSCYVFMSFVSFRIFVYCFCIVQFFRIFVWCFCIVLCFLYSTMMGPPCHRIPNCVIEQRFLPQILINSILVCTILWVEHNGHRRIQILFSSHPSFLCPGSGFSRIYPLSRGSGFSMIYPLSRIHGSCRGFCHVYIGIYVSKPFVWAKVYNTF